MNVGWIGLGKMGEPFALQALKFGHALTGHSRGGKPRPALAAAGARITDSLEETVRGAGYRLVDLPGRTGIRSGPQNSSGESARSLSSPVRTLLWS